MHLKMNGAIAKHSAGLPGSSQQPAVGFLRRASLDSSQVHCPPPPTSRQLTTTSTRRLEAQRGASLKVPPHIKVPKTVDTSSGGLAGHGILTPPTPLTPNTSTPATPLTPDTSERLRRL
jgi:hypothetical protein